MPAAGTTAAPVGMRVTVGVRVGVVVGGTLVAVGGTCVCVGVTVGWLVGWTEAVAWLFAWIAVRVIATRLSWVGVVAWVGRVSGRTQAASELTRSITIK
jgi:hypothetical protein